MKLQKLHNQFMQVSPSDNGYKKHAYICVVDISDSMGSLAVKEQNEVEPDFFSQLDLVKHSLNMLLEIMGADDQFCLITFSSSGKLIVPLSKLDKHSMKQKVAEMEAQGDTDIWSGLKLAVPEVKKVDLSTTICSLFVLTDGVSSKMPDNWSSCFKIPVHWFGYGNDIDSYFLYAAAASTDGMFGYISDFSMVGTYFINFLVGQQLVVDQGICVSADQKDYRIGQLIKNQSVCFEVPNLDRVEFANVRSLCDYKTVTTIAIAESADEEEYEFQQFRKLHLQNLMMQKDLQMLQNSDNPRVRMLLKEYRSDDPQEGQLTLAFQPQFVEVWGAHYIRSLRRQHELEFRGNFKDPGVQAYNADIEFQNIQLKFEDVFINLPAPPPSCDFLNQQSQQQYGNQQGFQYMAFAPHDNYEMREMNQQADYYAQAPQQQMARFYQQRGVCFDPKSMAQLSNGLQKQCRNIQKGDQLVDGSGKIDIVECIIQSVGQQFIVQTIQDGGFTPYHPVVLNGQYQFALNVSLAQYEVPEVINFVMKNRSNIVIGGVETVTLGHGLNDSVAFHEYFGSERIVNDLKDLYGYDQGHVVIDHSVKFIRDNDNQEVIRIETI